MNQLEAFNIWLVAARRAYQAGRGDLVERHFPPKGDTSQKTLVLLAARIDRDVKHYEVSESMPEKEV